MLYRTEQPWQAFINQAAVSVQGVVTCGGIGKTRLKIEAVRLLACSGPEFGPGMRWSRQRLNHLLPVRTAIMSNQFDQLWQQTFNSPPN